MVVGTVIGGASMLRRPEQQPGGVLGQRGERNDDQEQHDGQRQRHLASVSDLAIDSSLANIANGGSPRSTTIPTANEAPTESRPTHHAGDVVDRPSSRARPGVCPPARNSTVLPTPWARTWSSRAAIAS